MSKTDMNGKTVYVCETYLNPHPSQPDRGSWRVAGVVVRESDAQEWVADAPTTADADRRYTERTIGLVSDIHDV